MGDLKVTIEHGSGLSSLLSARTVVIGAAAVVLLGSGAASRLETGLSELVYWLAGVFGAVIIVVSYLAIRATRSARGQNYVESIHGPSDRNILIDENARMRRELADIRAMRRQIVAAEALGVPYRPDYMLRTAIVESSRHGYGPDEPK